MAVGEVLRMRRTPIGRGSREDSAIESGEGKQGTAHNTRRGGAIGLSFN